MHLISEDGGHFAKSFAMIVPGDRRRAIARRTGRQTRSTRVQPLLSQEVEPGACEEITAKAQRTVADEIKSQAALAENADVSDAELAALGDARFETPAIEAQPSGASPSANLSGDERSQATGADRSQVTLETGASSAVRSTG